MRLKQIYPVFSPVRCNQCGELIQRELGYFDKDTTKYFHKKCLKE